jgi:hypothetical protein
MDVNKSEFDKHFKLSPDLKEKIKEQEKRMGEINDEQKNKLVKSSDDIIEVCDLLMRTIDDYMEGNLNFEEVNKIVGIHMSTFGTIMGENFREIDKEKMVEKFIVLNDKIFDTMKLIDKEKVNNLNHSLFKNITLNVIATTISSFNVMTLEMNDNLNIATENFKIPDIKL